MYCGFQGSASAMRKETVHLKRGANLRSWPGKGATSNQSMGSHMNTLMLTHMQLFLHVDVQVWSVVHFLLKKVACKQDTAPHFIAKLWGELIGIFWYFS